jgi:site-specific DNA recombinase
MTPTQGAIDARGSAAQHAEAQTVASQGAAWRERVAAAGRTWPEAMPCMEAGYRGATRVRPAWERWRDIVAARAVDRGDVHAPDRLARKYASQVLLVDALRRAGVAGLCLHRALGQRPADALLLQVPGMSAESARAKRIDRHRRGKRHAARAGRVHVLRGAPYGARSVTKEAGGGQARSAMVPDEARLVRQVCAWVGRDRLTLGAVCRQLTRAGERTRPGKTGWDRRAGWGR